LDVSGLAKLKYLYAGNNNISEIDLKANTELKEVNLRGNKLSSLDLSANGKLSSVTASNNSIVDLKLPEGEAAKNISLSLDDNYIYLPIKDKVVDVSSLGDITLENSKLKIEDGKVDMSSYSNETYSIGFSKKIGDMEGALRGYVYNEDRPQISEISCKDGIITVKSPAFEDKAFSSAYIRIYNESSTSSSSNSYDLTVENGVGTIDLGSRYTSGQKFTVYLYVYNKTEGWHLTKSIHSDSARVFFE
jgi:Leucine-rich repeat (LRR) protein